MRAGIKDLASVWRLPGRALVLGLPLTALAIAAVAQAIVGITWLEALLVGVVLSPTDPVFAAAIVERREVPQRLRFLLNVESGVNDGLALPFVLLLLAQLQSRPLHPAALLSDLLLGIAIGFCVSWAALRLERLDLQTAHVYEPFTVFAIGIVIFALCAITNANEFLAAFTAGVTIASLSTAARDRFESFGGHLAELLKQAAVFVFASLISIEVLRQLTVWHYLFIVTAALLARPAGLLISMVGSKLAWKERLAAAWFGPKGFASVVYGLLLLHSGIANAAPLFHLVAMVVALSILAHSSTDVLVARHFEAASQGQPELS